MSLTYLTTFEVCVPCATAQVVVKIRHSWGGPLHFNQEPMIQTQLPQPLLLPTSQPSINTLLAN